MHKQREFLPSRLPALPQWETVTCAVALSAWTSATASPCGVCLYQWAAAQGHKQSMRLTIALFSSTLSLAKH